MYEAHPFVRAGQELAWGERVADRVVDWFGSWTYLGVQTTIVTCWIILNTTALVRHWDPMPFILLNLMFSTQASYAAPVILLAQNRKTQMDSERDIAAYQHGVITLQLLQGLVQHTVCPCSVCQAIRLEREEDS